MLARQAFPGWASELMFRPFADIADKVSLAVGPAWDWEAPRFKVASFVLFSP